MNEEFLYYLWIYQLTKGDMVTTSGEHISVISPGTRNTDCGPDFFNALIDIGDTRWAGNVEIHVVSSDWRKHNHQKDESYDNIILHVVYNDDYPVRRKSNELIPTLELVGKFNLNILSNYQKFLKSRNEIPCNKLIGTINNIDIIQWYDRLLVERLEKKSEKINDLLKNTKGDLLQVYYQQLARSLGYTTNADSMEMLAIATPLKLILKHSNKLSQIEAILFGQSGLLTEKNKDQYPKNLYTEYLFLKEKYNLSTLSKKVWYFMRMRPVSFPTIRISQLANIIYATSGVLTDILEIDKLNYVYSILSVSASAYWNNHFRFDAFVEGKKKMIGNSTIDIIMINTIIPFLFVYGKSKNNTDLQHKAITWLSQIKAESNKITREFTSYGLKAENAMESQALIQLKNNYCLKKRCLDCKFGFILLNRK